MIKVCSANFLQTCCHFRAVKRFMMGKPSAGIIIIGDEILKGQTQDTNTHFLAKNLQAQGIKLKRVVVIPDDIAIIASEIKSFSESYDYVLTSGGVGPTHDDVTYEGVAKAFDDKTFLHPEMEELIRKFFKDVNPAVLKLGQVPTTSTLNYPTKPLLPGQTKYPLVSVKNVFIFPGIPVLLQRSFMRMKDDLFNAGYKSHVREAFLTQTEIVIAEKLNHLVNKYENSVIFGSYPKWTHNYYNTKITIEADTEDLADQVLQDIKQQLPTIEYDMEPTVDIMDKIEAFLASNQDVTLKANVDTANNTMKKCFTDYTPDQVSVAFNGGKDNIAMIQLVHSFMQKNFPNRKDKLAALYVKDANPFPEVEEYIKETTDTYNLELTTIEGSMKNALGQFLKSKPHLKAMILGTRNGDPGSRGLSHFAPTDGDWPALVRVNPVIDWTYGHVWQFIRGLSVPYPVLYDKGYTSLGNQNNTLPNPNLAYNDDKGQTQYKPAYELTDWSLERAGRVKSNI